MWELTGIFKPFSLTGVQSCHCLPAPPPSDTGRTRVKKRKECDPTLCVKGISQKRLRERKTQDVTGTNFGEQISSQNNFSHVRDAVAAETHKTCNPEASPAPLQRHRSLPAFSRSLHIIHAVTDVSSLGLAITVLPAARAGATFQVSK